MARKILTGIDLAQNELQNAAIQNLASAPSNPVKGQMYFNSTGGNNTLYWWDGTAWQAAKSGVPAAHAASHNFGGGDALAADGTAATPMFRSLGTGAQQAAAGNHGHALTDAGITGALPESKGGTNNAGAFTVGGVVYHTGTSGGTLLSSLAGTAGQLLLSGGTSAPTWATHDTAYHSGIRLNGLQVPNGNIDMGGFKVVNTGTPTGPFEYANKTYVDSVAAGMDAHPSVLVASTAANTVVGTYVPGTGPPNGAGTITSAPNTLDGITLAANSRVLLKDCTNQKANGLWRVATLGTGANGLWIRPQDFTGDDGSTDHTSYGSSGAFTFVERGTSADTGWVLITDDPVAIDGASGSNLVWTQFSGAGAYTAGLGLTQSGTTFNIGEGAGIDVLADTIQVEYAGTSGDLGVATTVARSDHAHSTAYVPMARVLNMGAGLTIGGSASADLSANRSINASVFTSGVQGMAPASGGGTANFLRADGTWAAPGGGTVTKTVGPCAAATSTVLNHTQGKDCIVQVYRVASPFDEVECDIEHTSATSVTVRFGTAPAAGDYQIVVMG
jgi:hypothetical protein